MNPGAPEWSAPDADGVGGCRRAVGGGSTPKGNRRRQGIRRDLGGVPLWPSSWRELLVEWLRQGGARRKWTGLLQTAGGRRATEALHLLDALLRAGMVQIEERREGGPWQPQWIEFLDLESLREAVGLPNREKLERERAELHGLTFVHPALASLQQSLAQLPARTALRRHEILAALDAWITEERSGTRRDFALFARGDTKGISTSEWKWLEDGLDLEEAGIGRHTPALWLRAPLTLISEGGSLDLRCVPDAIALTPATIEKIAAIRGTVQSWRILENRTVFERVAKAHGASDGILWVPGFAPTWWKQSVGRLLDLCPAPALVACDPDPAGIDIALSLRDLWESRALAWRPWGMDPESVARLRDRKPLAETDRQRLDRLRSADMPEVLLNLIRWMEERGEKGEQEGNADLI